MTKKMSKEKYKFSINLHSALALSAGLLSITFCVLTQFGTGFSKPLQSLNIQIGLVLFAVLVAVLQYIYTRNIMKKQLAKLLNFDTIDDKVAKYHSLMVRSFYLSAFSLVTIAALSFFVTNNLLPCLAGLVLLFSVMLLKPSAHRMKMDLQLSEKEIAEIYGDKWNK